MGVSTNRIHSRGPMGVEGLLTYKYRLFGSGHVAGSYGRGKKAFTHVPLAKTMPCRDRVARGGAGSGGVLKAISRLAAECMAGERGRAAVVVAIAVAAGAAGFRLGIRTRS